jgi:hypothetical protein
MKTRTKTILATIAAATALTGFAGAASAQPYGYGYGSGYGYGYEHSRYDQPRYERGGDRIDQRQFELERRIEWGLRRGDLTPREAARLRDDMRDLAALEAHYRHNGMSWGERAELNRRLDLMERRIANQASDNQYSYGYRR